MSLESPGQRPEIDYPTRWTYQVIGTSRDAVETAARVAAGGRDHTIALSRRSASERYVSIRLEVEVEDEAARLSVFGALRSAAAVVLVL